MGNHIRVSPGPMANLSLECPGPMANLSQEKMEEMEEMEPKGQLVIQQLQTH
jgi:hypothetical protein